MNIFQILTDSAKAFGQKSALIFKDKIVSFIDLKANVTALARGLQALGLTRGKKIGLYLPNCPEYVYSYLSSFLLGAVVIPLDYMLKTDELTACLSHAEAEFVIALPKSEVDWNAIQKNIPSLKSIISLGPEFEGLFQSGEFKSNVVSDADPALIMYTSGTTGAPKGILLNYKHLQGSPQAMKYFVDLSERDVKLCAIPLSHIGGFIYIQNCIIFGITLVLMDRFHPMEFLKNVVQYKVTCFHIVPPMYTAMLTVKHIDQFDLSSLRWVVVFGAPNSPDILERFHKYCPNAKLLNGWGMTETCPPNTVTPLNNPKIESVGKPAPNCEIHIVDDEDKALSTGSVGEIVIRGWVVMQEYYKDPQATLAAKRGGWFHTGDLGRFDNEGFLYIVGRKKEMIKVAGQIVYAPEVEAALCKHEAVLEAAVIGVADDMRGESVKAFVVLKEGFNIEGLEIKYFAKEYLANFKVPQTIEIRSALPKNRTGKIDKELLKNENGSPIKTFGDDRERKGLIMSTTTVDRMTRDVHLSGKDLMAMVQLRPQDVGSYAIVPGPKERLDSVVKKMENPVKNFSFMEYNMFTGNINGIRVTAINGGRFGADTAITTEILCNAQVKALIRIGSCGAMRKDMKVGDFILTTGCVRGDGVSPYYVDDKFVTLPDAVLTQKLGVIAKNLAATADFTVHEGKVWSTDAILRETKEIVNGVIDKGAVGVDMVSAPFLTIAQTYKIPAVSILAISDNLITGQMGFINPDYYMAEGMLIQMAVELVKQLESGK